MTLNTILVALDESVERSQHVIDNVANLKLSATSKIVLCHILNPTPTETEVADLPHKYAEAIPYRQIEKQLQSYQEQLPCASEIEIVIGEPVTEIVRLANIYNCDLIAIGSRGLTGVKRIIQGSISSQVVDESPCSVLVIKRN
jgi:nucleotide-binding universal stress UspA family protein